MSPKQDLLESLDRILVDYRDRFRKKKFTVKPERDDLLMRVFKITPEIKKRNMQYWSRHLGFAWEKLLKAALSEADKTAVFPLPGDKQKPCDMIAGEMAIDAKYRIGSGDSGTLQKLQKNGRILHELGYKPVLLIFRDDSLASSLAAARGGGWTIYEDKHALVHAETLFNFDMSAYLKSRI
ncbi:hypothetical protein D3C71_189490 [compost metagenome]